LNNWVINHTSVVYVLITEWFATPRDI